MRHAPAGADIAMQPEDVFMSERDPLSPFQPDGVGRWLAGYAKR